MNLIMTQTIWQHSKSTGTNRLVLLAIAYHMNQHHDEAWPSIETLAADVNRSVRQVKRAIQELQEAGEVEVGEGRGRGNVNTYRITIKGDTHDTFSTQNDTIPEPEKVTSEVIKGDTHDTFSSQIDTPTEPEKVTSEVRKGDTGGKKGDTGGKKGDTHVTQKDKKDKRRIKEGEGETPETEKILRVNLRDLYDQLMLEVQERQRKWLELPPDKIRGLVRQAGQKNGGKFRTKLIKLLDLETGLIEFSPTRNSNGGGGNTRKPWDTSGGDAQNRHHPDYKPVRGQRITPPKRDDDAEMRQREASANNRRNELLRQAALLGFTGVAA
jgi:hypothetical protein